MNSNHLHLSLHLSRALPLLLQLPLRLNLCLDYLRRRLPAEHLDRLVVDVGRGFAGALEGFARALGVPVAGLVLRIEGGEVGFGNGGGSVDWDVGLGGRGEAYMSFLKFVSILALFVSVKRFCFLKLR
jgi:hypothetical protein